MSIYSQAFRYRWRTMAILFFAVLILAVLFVILRPASYTASAQLFVRTGSAGGGVDLNQSGQFAQQRVKSYVELADSPQVLDPVIRELNLDTDAERFAQKVSASAPPDTVLVEVAVTDADPRLARSAANLIAQRFTEISAELEAPRNGSSPPVSVEVTRPATLPATPNGVSPRTVVGLGVLAGLALGLGCAVLQDAFSPRLFDATSAARRLRVPILAEISSASRRSRSVGEEGLARLTPYGFLRAGVFRLQDKRSGQSVLVTSIAPDTSTADVAVGLASSFAASGARVVVVEGSPNQHELIRQLKVPGGQPGLIEVFLTSRPVRELVVPTGIPHVNLLFFGSGDGSRFELPVGQQVSMMLDELGGMVDVVIVNGAGVSDPSSSIWAVSAASTVLCVPPGVKETGAVRALDVLEAAGAVVSGLVLKGAPPPPARASSWDSAPAGSIAEPSPDLGTGSAG